LKNEMCRRRSLTSPTWSFAQTGAAGTQGLLLLDASMRQSFLAQAPAHACFSACPLHPWFLAATNDTSVPALHIPSLQQAKFCAWILCCFRRQEPARLSV